MSARALLAGALLLGALLAGCGGEQHRRPRQGAAGQPATDAQVLMLARVLESDFEHGGSRFTAAFQIDGQRALASGRVDFRSGRGTAVVRPANADLGPGREFFWTRRKVLTQAAPGSRRYTPEVPDAQGNPVHTMMKFINLLSAETIDNTANISAAKPRLIGRTTIAGVPVDEFRYGNGITLWLHTGTGLLRRVHTSRVTGGLTVDLLTHEPVKIELPPVARR
jgi:hypothetical protein